VPWSLGALHAADRLVCALPCAAVLSGSWQPAQPALTLPPAASQLANPPASPLAHPSCREIFNLDHFLAATRGQGVHVAAQVPEGARTAHFNLAQQYNALSTIRGAGIGVQHVRWGGLFAA